MCMITNLFKILVINVFVWNAANVFENQERDFRVVFPLEYGVQKDTIAVEVGEVYITNVFSSSSDSSMEDDGDKVRDSYSLTYMKYPEGILSKDSTGLINDLIELSLEQRLKAINGKVDYAADLENEEYQGKQVRLSGIDNPELLLRAKFIVYNNYFIALQTISNKKSEDSSDIQNFQNSFRVITH